MLVVTDAYDSADLPQGGVVTIGNFDGLHLGQQAILKTVVARAAELAVPAVVVTFDPHPLAILRPEQTPVQLTVPRQKEALLAELGVSALLVVRFTRELARLPAERFVRDFLVRELALAEIYVGQDFAFGHRREGNLALLTRLGEKLGFAVHGVEEVVWGGERISSTRLRRAIAEGRVEDAAVMLGRPYAIHGTVARGDRMGQRLGWPTINVASEHKLLPADGVYACRVHFPNYPATFDGVTNVGTRPTVYENYQRVVESHILDFANDVYGEPTQVAFYKRLREERIFPTVMDLSAQIGRDVETTRDYFARQRAEAGAEAGTRDGGRRVMTGDEGPAGPSPDRIQGE